MARIKGVELSDEQRRELEHEYRTGGTHSYRKRCRGVLLKGEMRSSAVVAWQLNCHEVTVNGWLRRYQAEGVKGLKTRSGWKRKPILDETDG